MNGWPSVDLAEVCQKPQYGAIAKGSKNPLGPLFVRQTDIASGHIDWSSVPFCDLPQWEFDKYAIRPGDILISRLGNGVGNAATVHETRDAVFAGYLVRFQTQRSKADPEFIGYQLQSCAWRHHVASFRSGAAQPTLNAQQMGAFQFLLPPLDEQQAIAATLRSIDERIESNRRAFALAETLADQLFARQVSGTAVLTDIAQLTMGSSPPGDTYNEEGEGLPFYQGVRDFGRRFPAYRVWTTGAVRLAHEDDSLISVRAPVGELNRSREICCVGRGVAAVRSDHPSTLYYSLRAAEDLWEPFQHEGTVFGAINKADLSNARLPWPGTDGLGPLEYQLSAIDDKIRSLMTEIERLTALRDTLLPELLSGRIRVPESRKIVREVVS